MSDYMDKTSESMRISFYENRKIISVYCPVYEKTRDIDDEGNNTDEYVYGQTVHTVYKKTVGVVLIDYLNTNFEDFKSFFKFFFKWGISGLKGINNNDIEFSGNDYRIQEFEQLMKGYWNNSKYDLFEAKDNYKNLLRLVYNIDKVDYLDELTPLQRYYIFSIKNKNIIDEIKNYSIKAHIDYTFEIPGSKFKSFSEYTDFTCSSEEEIAKRISSYGKIEPQEEIIIQDIRSLCSLEIMSIIQNNIYVKRCEVESCNKYFIPVNRSDEVYCNECKKNGYEMKLKSDEVLRLYRSKNKVNDARKRRSLNPLEKDRIEEWKTKAKNKLKLYKENKLSAEEFKKWLMQ